MVEPDGQSAESQEPEAPAALVEGLRKLMKNRVMVPRHVDERILATAWQHLETVAPRRRRVGRWIVRGPFRRTGPGAISGVPEVRTLARVGVALAAVVIGVLLWLGQFEDPADIDGNGHVNILDAFFLARQLEQSPMADQGRDLNGDGTTDLLDVEVIALRSVALTEGTGS